MLSHDVLLWACLSSRRRNGERSNDGTDGREARQRKTETEAAGWNKGGDEGRRRRRRNNAGDGEQEQMEGSHHYGHQDSDTTRRNIVTL